MSSLHDLNLFLARLVGEDAVLVTVDAARGSVPREEGAWMAVFANAVLGTIGGGHLEHEAVREARIRFQGTQGGGDGAADSSLRFALGPSLGQCCGGEVRLRLQRVSAADSQRLAVRLRPRLCPVALFGGGHVGRALVRVMSDLPFGVHWIDSRDEVFPKDLPENVLAEHSDPVQAAVPDLEPGSRVLIMSFSHAEDLDVLAACLLRQRQQADLPFLGLIGSQTKWATFRRRLRERGFDESEMAHVTCPIGVPGVVGKQPEVIAVAVAAQLLQTLPLG